MVYQDKKPQDKKPTTRPSSPTEEEIEELKKKESDALVIQAYHLLRTGSDKSHEVAKALFEESTRINNKFDLNERQIRETSQEIVNSRKFEKNKQILRSIKIPGLDLTEIFGKQMNDRYMDLHKDYVTPSLVKEINKGKYSAEPEHAVNPKDMLDTGGEFRKPESRPYKVTIPGGMEVGMYGSIFNSLLSDYLDSKQDNQPKPGGQSNTPQDKQPTSKPSKGGESKDGGQPNQNQQASGGDDFSSTVEQTKKLVELASSMGDMLMKDPNVQQQMQSGQSQFGQPQAPGITPFGRDVDRAISEVFPQQGPNPTSIMYDELQKLIAAPMQSPGDIVSKNAALASKYALEGNVKLANRHAQTADYLADALQKVEPYHSAQVARKTDLQKEILRTGAGIEGHRITGEANVKSRQYATDVAREESERKRAEDEQPEKLARSSETATYLADLSSSLTASDPETLELLQSGLADIYGDPDSQEERMAATGKLIDNYALDMVFNKGFTADTIDRGPLNVALTKATERINGLNSELAKMRAYGTVGAATLTDQNARMDEANRIRGQIAYLKEATKEKVASYSQQKAYLEDVQRRSLQTANSERGGAFNAGAMAGGYVPSVSTTKVPTKDALQAKEEMTRAEYTKAIADQLRAKEYRTKKNKK